MKIKLSMQKVKEIIAEYLLRINMKNDPSAKSFTWQQNSETKDLVSVEIDVEPIETLPAKEGPYR